MGLYMIQPYEPGKIPVLMVHGLWSSPMTWMEMFNDLRSIAGDPRALPVLVLPVSDGPAVLDQRGPVAPRPGRGPRRCSIPEHREPALDQMVLIGHSMGGLVSRLQTIQQRRRLLAASVSDEPFEQVKAEPGDPRAARETLLLPAEPVDPPRGDHRHAAPRQQHSRTRPRSGC